MELSVSGVFSDYDNECRDVYHNLREVLLAKILKATDCLWYLRQHPNFMSNYILRELWNFAKVRWQLLDSLGQPGRWPPPGPPPPQWRAEQPELPPDGASLFFSFSNWLETEASTCLGRLYTRSLFIHTYSRKFASQILTFRFMSRERGDIRELFILTRSILLKHAPHCSQLSLLLAGRKMQRRQNGWLSCAFADQQKQKKL